MTTITLLVVIVVTFLLGKYAIEEGQRIERNKRFIKDFEKFDKKNKNEKK
jgi:hypothetical protein|tara:strand:+ start:197 stop:346 length:150 start_codon:yes stop_codon:yes gene_type:complete